VTHAEASEQLSTYLDGELTDAERAALEAQLAQDPSLRSELEQIEAAVTFLRTHGPIQAPPDFRDKVLAAVQDEPMPGGWWRWLRRPFGLPIEGLAIALAAALVLIVALPLGLHKPATQVKDLAADPYGFVSREERAAPSSSPKEQADDRAEPGAKAAPATAVPSAVQQPAQNASGASSIGGDGTAAVDATGSGTAQAPQPAPGAVYAYQILTGDTDALAKLQRIAARYRGQVLDAKGRPVQGALQPGASYTVELPSSALAPFGDDLRTLGMVTEIPQPSAYAGGTVKVQIAFDLVPDRRTDTPRPATTTTEH